MQRIKLSLLALTLLFVFSLSFDAGNAQAGNLVVTLANKTDAPVYVAIGAISGGGESDGDFAKGWWRVDPGQTKNVSVGFYSPVYEYFYYASSMGGKRLWRGKSDGATFWIHPTKAFNSHPDRKIAGGKRVDFRHMGVSTNGKAKLTFTVR
jgi:uncharacterized membrane protein